MQIIVLFENENPYNPDHSWIPRKYYKYESLESEEEIKRIVKKLREDQKLLIKRYEFLADKIENEVYEYTEEEKEEYESLYGKLTYDWYYDIKEVEGL